MSMTGLGVFEEAWLRHLAGVTLLAGSLILGGCGEPSSAPVVIAVGGAPDELAVWQELITAFADSSGIRTEVLRQPADTDQRRQGLVVALAASRPDPDLFLMDVAWVGLFAAAGWLQPLAGVDTSAFFPDILHAVDFHQGQLVALPVDLDAGLLYYRTDLLRKYGIEGPPATLAELRESARKVQEAERRRNPAFYGFVWQGAQYEGLVVDFLEFAGTAGGLHGSQGGWTVDLPANRQALRSMHDFIWRDGISPPSTYTEMREEQARSFFQRGDALYERNWPYAWALHQARDSAVRDKVGVAPLPAATAGERASILGGWHVGVSRHSDAPAQARQLALYLTSHAVQKAMALRLGWNPGRRDLYDDPDLRRRLPHLTQLARVFAGARSRPVVPYYPQLSEVLQRQVNAVLADRLLPEQALVRADAGFARVVRRYAPQLTAEPREGAAR